MQYGVFKRVLLDLHAGASGLSESSVEAKIKDFRKRGLPPAAPGKGKRAELSLEDLASTHFALRLNSCGVPPSLITEIGKDFGEDRFWTSVKRHREDTWVALRRPAAHPEQWTVSVYPLGRIKRLLDKSEVSLPTILVNLSMLLREVSTRVSAANLSAHGSSEAR